MKYSLKTLGLVAGTALLFVIVGTFVGGPKAHAATIHGSDIISTGDFNGSGAMNGMAIPSSVNTVPEFKTFIHNLIYSNGAYGIPGSTYNEYGAAFLVETMLHGQHDYAANSGLVSAARSDYNNWADIIDSYPANKINMSMGNTANIRAGSLNSMHQCRDPAGYCWDRAVYYDNDYNGGGYDAHKFHFFNMDSSEASTLITFTNPDGSRFQIRRECGNVIGSASPVKAYPPVLQGYKISNTGSASGPFAGDRVNALYGPGYGYYHGNTDQPFFFTGGVQLVAGSWKVSVTDYSPGDGAWKYIGYQVCLSGDGSCKLDGHTGVRSPNTAFSMAGGKTYNIRIVFKQDTCPAGTTGTPPNCIDISGNCPQDAKINGSELVNVALPDNSPSTPAHSTRTSQTAGTAAPARYIEYDREPSKKTVVTAVTDISSGGNRVSIPHTNDQYQQTTLNYHNFVTTYPNDRNQAAVSYRNSYNEIVWTPHYAGRSSCAAGETTYSTYCKGTGRLTLTPGEYETCVTKSGKTTCTWHYYSCATYGYSGTAPNCYYNYTYTYNRTDYYNWTAGAAVEKQATGYQPAYEMNACYFRDFQVQTVTPAASFLPYSGELEDPTGVQGSSTGSVKFSVSHGTGLRVAYKLNDLDYTLYYTQACTDTDGGSLGASGGFARSETDSWSLDTDPACTNMTPSPPIIGSIGCAEYGFDRRGGKVDVNGDIQSYAGGAISGSGCTPKIENQAYLKVFGGDVLAGAGFTTGATCAAPGNGQILGWNKGNDGSAYDHGAGVEFAAYAISHINEFATAQRGGVNGADPPSGLAFANNPLSGSDYGGRLAGAGCIPDYYSQKSGSALPNMNVSTLTAHTYSSTGDVGTNGANGLYGTVHSGEQVTVYVNGDVYISNNIVYATAGAIKDMPSFTLVATGNIYISGNVTQLDGNYIAQNSKIYDCAAANNTPYAPSAIYGSCQQKLTVNGSFVSKQTLFLRTGAEGSLRFSDGDAGIGNNNASEEFDYTPSLWLAPPSNTSQPPAYDSITSLPPVL